MAIYVAIGGVGSRNHLAYPDVYIGISGVRRVSEYRITWCGIKIDRRRTRRYKWEKLLPGASPVTCELCIGRLTGRARE